MEAPRLSWSSIIATVLVFLLISAEARAQTGFTCPKAGTIVNTGRYRSIYRGADPSDPVVCLITHPDGHTVRRLYDWYDPETLVSPSFAHLFS